jgi:hypothetical protein
MNPHGEYRDRLAALDARLARLLDAVRRARHDVDRRQQRPERRPSSREEQP